MRADRGGRERERERERERPKISNCIYNTSQRGTKDEAFLQLRMFNSACAVGSNPSG